VDQRVYKDTSGAIFHTYSAYARGTETSIGAYNYLDLVPKAATAFLEVARETLGRISEEVVAKGRDR